MSAFNLLEQIIPQKPNDEILEQRKETIKTHLKDFMDVDDQGCLELKLKLPDQSALDNISAALAKLVR